MKLITDKRCPVLIFYSGFLCLSSMNCIHYLAGPRQHEFMTAVILIIFLMRLFTLLCCFINIWKELLSRIKDRLVIDKFIGRWLMSVIYKPKTENLQTWDTRRHVEPNQRTLSPILLITAFFEGVPSLTIPALSDLSDNYIGSSAGHRSLDNSSDATQLTWIRWYSAFSFRVAL